MWIRTLFAACVFFMGFETSAGNWYGDTVTVAEEDGFAQADLATSYEALVDMFQIAVTSINPGAWRGRFKEGRRYLMEIPTKPGGRRVREIDIHITRLKVSSSRKRIKLDVDAEGLPPATIKIGIDPGRRGTSLLEVLVEADTPGIGEILSGVVNTIFSKPYTWGLELWSQAESAPRAARKAKKSTRDQVRTFLRVWAAFAEFKARNPGISVTELATSKKAELQKSILLRSPFGHSLSALDVILQTLAAYGPLLESQGVLIESESFSFYQGGSRITLRSQDLSLTLTAKRSSEKWVVLAATAVTKGFELPTFEIVLSEAPENLQGDEITKVAVEVKPSQEEVVRLLLTEPEKAFSILERVLLLSQKISRVGAASASGSNPAPVTVLTDFWSELARKISEEGFDVGTSGVEVCSIALMGFFFQHGAELKRLGALISEAW